MSAPQIEFAYPVNWPVGRPRTTERKPARFNDGGKTLLFDRAVQRLAKEVYAVTPTCLHPELALPVLARVFHPDPSKRLPMACGLGTAIIGEPRLGTEIAEEFGVPRANDSDRDQHANWGWPMLEVEAWSEPIPMRGAQGLWNWPTPEQFADDLIDESIGLPGGGARC